MKRGRHFGDRPVEVVRCASGKSGFVKGEAERRLAQYAAIDDGRARTYRPVRIYHCTLCDRWHLTSQAARP